MHTIKYKLLFFLALVSVVSLQSCDESNIIDDVNEGLTFGAVLRVITIDPNVNISNPSSSFDITLEEQDRQQGNLLDEVRVFIGFIDNTDDGVNRSVGQNLFTTIPASEFSPGEFGLPRTSFSVTLSEMANFTGVAMSNINPDLDLDDDNQGDQFVVSVELQLTDGRVFNVSNASSDITASGRFSFFNSQFTWRSLVLE